MAISIIRYSFVIVIFIFVLAIQTITGGGGLSKCRKLPGKPPALFIFGDSYLDSGNNNYINTTTLDQANFWPYGETYFNFPTGRFSDGRLISDFIAEYAKLPLIPPFLLPGVDQREYFYNRGINFASAGAGALVETFEGAVISLKTQLRYYKKAEAGFVKKLGNIEAKMSLSRAVYLFSIGTNDYTSLFITNSTILNSISHSQYVGTVIGNLTTAITEIYKRGGRRFGFINLGPLGCLPGLRILGPQSNSCLDEEASLLAKLHNKALSKSLSRMGKHLQGFKYNLYDFNTNLQRRMTNPRKYGFKEGEAACCGTGWLRGTLSCGGKRPVKEFELCDDPNEYVFWDSYHLTQSVYKQMANQMWNGRNTGGSNGNYNLKTLFHCL